MMSRVLKTTMSTSGTKNTRKNRVTLKLVTDSERSAHSTAHDVRDGSIEYRDQPISGIKLHTSASVAQPAITCKRVVTRIRLMSAGRRISQKRSTAITAIRYMLVQPTKNMMKAEIVHPICLNGHLYSINIYILHKTHFTRAYCLPTCT